MCARFQAVALVPVVFLFSFLYSLWLSKWYHSDNRRLDHHGKRMVSTYALYDKTRMFSMKYCMDDAFIFA